jgi:cell division septum initiation protein DivIVA
LTDGWMKTRTKGQHAEAEPEAPRVVPPPRAAQPPGPPDGPHGTDVQQAMQMLTLAQRTADEHVATAHRQAQTIQTEAGAAAEQIVREAQSQADAIRKQADTALAEARAQVEQASRDVQANADTARQNAAKILSDAQAQAAEIAAAAKANADGLDRLAKQRYDEEVGNLAAKREALQQQIESLQEFDRDYRSRLLTFMQAQLRALWVDEPQVDGEVAGTPSGKVAAAKTPAPGSAGPAPATPAPAGQAPAQAPAGNGAAAPAPAAQGVAAQAPAAQAAAPAPKNGATTTAGAPAPG